MGLFTLIYASLFGAEEVYLKTPNISRENIIGTTMGIRPFRKSGIRIEAEMVQDKLIIHNYGYGGSGLTLAFGGAKEVLDILQLENSSSKKIAVIGAGVVGLVTAYDLLEQGYQVHLYADKWVPHLTSNIAAGIWSPLVFPSDLPKEKLHLHERMLKISEARFLQSTTADPEFAGVRLIWSYSFKGINAKEAIKSKHQGDEVIAHFDNGITKIGRRVQEIGLEGQLFMEDLYSKVLSKGATVTSSHFETLDDFLGLEESVIINCTSMGSIKLFNDQEFIPSRGQMVYFKPQHDFDYLFFQSIHNASSDTLYYVSIYPWSDRIILGGIYEHGQGDPTLDPAVIEQLLQNADAVFMPQEGSSF